VGAKLDARTICGSVRTVLQTARPAEQWGRFHLVYSMGLFDYLTDSTAAAVLQKLWDLVLPGGELVVGNFHPKNESRVFMEYWADWVLWYRDEQDVLQLAGELPGRTAPRTSRPPAARCSCTPASEAPPSPRQAEREASATVSPTLVPTQASKERDQAALQVYLWELAHDWSKTLTVLGFTLVPLFFFLDYFTVPPEKLTRFAVYRLAPTVVAVGQYVVLRLTRPGPSTRSPTATSSPCASAGRSR
jgi:hypothetical protein